MLISLIIRLGGKHFGIINHRICFPAKSPMINKIKISKKILHLIKQDQAIRDKHWQTKSETDLAKIKKIDKANQKEFKKILQTTKYLGKEYGKNVQEAAFLLIQHMSRTDLPLMRRYLTQLKKHIDEVPHNQIALLTDRIKNWEGKKQHYGTQFEYVNNEYKIKPIWNIKEVDKRRKELGLEPLNKYIEKLQKERKIVIKL